jgi:hypothetical protein
MSSLACLFLTEENIVINAANSELVARPPTIGEAVSPAIETVGLREDLTDKGSQWMMLQPPRKRTEATGPLGSMNPSIILKPVDEKEM